MKLYLRHFIIAIAILSIGSCNKTESELSDIKLLSSNVSDCKYNKSADVIIKQYLEKIKVEATGDNNYRISHENTFFNCCLPEGIEVAITLKQDSIFINEMDKGQGYCNCICPYDVVSEIGPVADGSYVLCILKDGFRDFEFELDLNAATSTEWSVSELRNIQ